MGFPGARHGKFSGALGKMFEIQKCQDRVVNLVKVRFHSHVIVWLWSLFINREYDVIMCGLFAIRQLWGSTIVGEIGPDAVNNITCGQFFVTK